MGRLVAMFLIIALPGCSRVPVKTELGSAITAAASKGEKSIIDLNDLADFAWDEVCVLGPFMRPVDISSTLGFQWNGKRSGARGSLVFIDTRHPRSDSVATGHLPIRQNDWLIAAVGCIARDSAKFTVRTIGNGPMTLVPIGGITPQGRMFVPTP